MKNISNNLLIIGLIESPKWLGSVTILRLKKSERIQVYRDATRAADERLPKLIFNGKD